MKGRPVRGSSVVAKQLKGGEKSEHKEESGGTYTIRDVPVAPLYPVRRRSSSGLGNVSRQRTRRAHA